MSNDFDLRDDIPFPLRRSARTKAACGHHDATSDGNNFDLRDDIPLPPERKRDPLHTRGSNFKDLLWITRHARRERNYFTSRGQALDPEHWEFVEHVRLKGCIDGYALGAAPTWGFSWAEPVDNAELLQARIDWTTEHQRLARTAKERRERWRREQEEWDAAAPISPAAPILPAADTQPARLYRVRTINGETLEVEAPHELGLLQALASIPGLGIIDYFWQTG
jgi:hypothetical protein